MLKENEIFLDVNLSPKENLRKIKKQIKQSKNIFFSAKSKNKIETHKPQRKPQNHKKKSKKKKNYNIQKNQRKKKITKYKIENKKPI